MYGIRAKPALAATGLLTALAALHVWSLMRIPAPFVDEAWLASRAWSSVGTGLTFGPLDGGVFDRYAGYWTFLPWLPNFIMSLPYRLAGPDPTLLPVRGLSLVFGATVLLAAFAIGSRVAGRRAGYLAVALTALSLPFIISAHIARYDIFAATFGFAAIALHFWAGGKPLAGLLAGLLAGAAFECHPHSVMFGPAIAILYFVDWRWAALRKPSFWAFVLGSACGVLAYTALHILPYPETYFALNRLAFAPTHTPPLLTLDPQIIFRGFTDLNWMVVNVYGLPMTILAIWGFVRLGKAGPPQARKLVLVTLVLLIGDALLIRNKADYYAILFTPALDLVVAVLIVTFFAQPGPRRRLALANRLVVVLALGWFAANQLAILAENQYTPYALTQDRIASLVEPGDTLLAGQTYWFGLFDHRYYSWEELIYYQRYQPGASLADAFAAFRPTVFVVDPEMRRSILDRPGSSPYEQYLSLERPELEAFLGERGALLDDFETLDGPVQVYRISWDGEGLPQARGTVPP